MIVPPKEFFPLLRKLCDAHGIVLVDDEVQAGMGRTGKLWAIENWNTVADILVSGKAVGGGLPFGGVTGKPAVMDRPGPGSLGGRFGGNPVVCAAALEAIDEIKKALPKTKRLESLIRKRLDEIFEGRERVGGPRHRGDVGARVREGPRDERAGRGTRAGRPARRPQERTHAPHGGGLQQLHSPAPPDQHPPPPHAESARPARRQPQPGPPGGSVPS